MILFIGGVMNNGQIYAFVVFVCILQLSLIFNRSVHTKHKETIDRPFIGLLIFFILFTVVDLLWGICDSGVFNTGSLFFTLVTYAYHVMCGLSAFMWVGYIMKYIGSKKRKRLIINIIRSVLLVAQFAMIIANMFTHASFYIDADLGYHVGALREYMYGVQFLYYIMILLYATIMYFVHFHGSRKTLYRNVLVFSLVPLAFGIGQYLFYNVAMYSMGFMLSAFIIYAYNLTDIREKHLTRVAEDSTRISFIDALTGLLNRRAYEEALNLLEVSGLASNFVYISMDLNELKHANDELGHEAGDEILKGAADIMLKAFAAYGRIYRTGGDEYAALLNMEEKQLAEAKNNFLNLMKKWSGELVPSLNVSCGFVGRWEHSDMDIKKMAKVADERMYQDKARYYATKGVDRRGQTEAFSVLCTVYTKILKVNLSTDTYQIIKMEEDEKSHEKGFSDHFFKWLSDFGTSGQIFKDDLPLYLEKTAPEYLKEQLHGGKSIVSIPYRRLIGGSIHDCIMEIIPSGDYSEANQTVFLYVKVLDL